MVVQNLAEMGKGSAIPTDPYHTPTIIQPSTSQSQGKQRSRRPKRKDTKVPQPSGPTTNVADKGRYGDDIMFDVSDLAGEEVFVAEQGVPDSKKDDAAQVNTAATTVSTASTIPVSAASITDVEITLAQALAERLVIHEQEQAPTPIVSSQQPSRAKIQDKSKAKMIKPKPVRKLSKKDQLKLDEEVAQSLMEVIPNEEEIAVDVIPLATKPPSIVDWKIHKKGKKNYYQIIRANGSSKMYLVFSHMLKLFDREDMETLYKLVKAKYGSTRPVEM
ncbi:hypothetical protein Tco_0201428 [Tanacetum coccineum]